MDCLQLGLMKSSDQFFHCFVLQTDYRKIDGICWTFFYCCVDFHSQIDRWFACCKGLPVRSVETRYITVILKTFWGLSFTANHRAGPVNNIDVSLIKQVYVGVKSLKHRLLIGYCESPFPTLVFFFFFLFFFLTMLSNKNSVDAKINQFVLYLCLCEGLNPVS